jgi:hypothetical protein
VHATLVRAFQADRGPPISLPGSEAYGETLWSWSIKAPSYSWLNFEVFLNLRVIAK